MADVPNGSGEQPKPPEQPAVKTAEEKLAELEKQNQELRKQFTEVSERASKTDELLNAYVSTYGNPEATRRVNTNDAPPPAAGKEDEKEVYAKISEDPVGVLSRLKQDIIQDVTNMYQRVQYGQKVQSYFYGKYPELKEHGAIVRAIADQVEAKYPGLPVDKMLDQVAQETKNYIGRIRSGSNTPDALNVAGGGAGDGKPPDSPPADKKENLTDVQSYIEERRKAREGKTL
jgi:hypothetical protein